MKEEKKTTNHSRAQELCQRRGGGPGRLVPNTNSPYGLCGREATLKEQ